MRLPETRRAVVAVVWLFAGLSLVLAGLLLFTGVALAQPVDAGGLVLEGEAKTRVEGLQGQAAAVQADIDRLDVELEHLTERYNLLTLELADTNSELTRMRSKLRSSQDVYNTRRQQLNDRLTATYKAKNDSLFDILLLTRNLNDFVKRLVLISKITSSDNRLVQGYQSVTSDISGIEEAIRAKKRQAQDLERALEGQRAAIEAKLVERKATLDGVNTQIAREIEQERLRQEAERLRLQAELQARLAAQASMVAANGGIIPVDSDPVLRQVVETAAAYMGVPYVWGGETPSVGLDCSGLVLYVFRQHGVSVPHYSGYQATLGAPVTLETIRPADLVFFGDPVHHVAIYIGEGKIIEAPRTGDVVKVTALSQKSRVVAVRRFPLQLRQGAPLFD